MTWAEFKEYVEKNGVEDETEIKSIDIFRPHGDPDVEINHEGANIYQ